MARPSPSWLRAPAPSAARALVAFAFAGCGYDTDIYGMYFPSWVIAPALGGLIAGGLLSAIGRSRYAPYLGNRTVLFMSLTVILGVSLWWVAFRG